MKEDQKIVIYQTEDWQTQIDVRLENETVWLTRQQLATLFGRDYKTISKHINNALKEELADEVVVAKFANTTQHGAIEGKTQTHEIEYFNLEMVASVGYRVKSKRGVQFRKWANKVLKDYLVKGLSNATFRFQTTWVGRLDAPGCLAVRPGPSNRPAPGRTPIILGPFTFWPSLNPLSTWLR